MSETKTAKTKNARNEQIVRKYKQSKIWERIQQFITKYTKKCKTALN